MKDNLSRHPKATAYWFSKYFFNASPAPTFTSKQRQAAASYAAAKAGLQRRVPAEPLTVAVGPVSQPLVKVAIGPQAVNNVAANNAGPADKFILPLTVDVSDNKLFSFNLRIDGKK